jgi:hypothetical protein
MLAGAGTNKHPSIGRREILFDTLGTVQHRADRATHLCAHDVAQHRSDRIAAGELFFETRMLHKRLASGTDPTSSSAQVGNRSDVEYRLASG